ncbi:threonine synthase [Maricaulis sp.]|uniref:threonine synthase n=1 Tax=Maricaulis sp. TaxID=1486257 RepID=UPI001B154A67|nr:threonine synthase [Maricaulis sp.]MBO6764501.1 threonine synthase [Maricaulis sp.]
MLFHSTRGNAPAVTADIALKAGAAPDGGLYLPGSLPGFTSGDFADTPGLGDLGARLLAPFFEGSPLADAMADICHDAFDFPAPRVSPDASDDAPAVLELFHGPTGAFKDFGARFLFRSFSALGQDADAPITVLVATSGDTGGAVGCAAEGVPGVRAVILFPKGRISAFQEHQLCCWKPPVSALRVAGDFDACQALVKAAFADADLTARHSLTSANSISIGRLLPQMVYWSRAALDTEAETGAKPGLVIPTGNLGNAFAAILARACGLPIGPIVLATNANTTLSDWFASGRYSARASIATIANAMDVGAPSNFERLDGFDGGAIAGVECIDDDTIRTRIRTTFENSGYIACPHTATGLEAHARLPEAERKARPWIVAATAHPGKFADIVEPVIGRSVELPPALAGVLQREVRVSDIPESLQALEAHLTGQLAPD